MLDLIAPAQSTPVGLRGAGGQTYLPLSHAFDRGDVTATADSIA